MQQNTSSFVMEYPRLMAVTLSMIYHLAVNCYFGEADVLARASRPTVSQYGETDQDGNAGTGKNRQQRCCN